MPIKSYTTNNDPSNHRSLSNLTPNCRLLCACAEFEVLYGGIESFTY